MKPHPRIRKTIKWGGAVLTVLLVAAWVGSCIAEFDVVLGDMVARVGISQGQISLDYAPYDNDFGMPGGLSWHPPEHRWFVPPSAERGDWGLQWIVWVPLWCLSGLSLAGTTAAWRADAKARRGRFNLCPKCNYDRAGLAGDAKCPECGAVSGASDSPAVRP